jgi:hypothetical protein
MNMLRVALMCLLVSLASCGPAVLAEGTIALWDAFTPSSRAQNVVSDPHGWDPWRGKKRDHCSARMQAAGDGGKDGVWFCYWCRDFRRACPEYPN